MLVIHHLTLDSLSIYYYEGDILMCWYGDKIKGKLYEELFVSHYRNMHSLRKVTDPTDIIHDDGEA